MKLTYGITKYLDLKGVARILGSQYTQNQRARLRNSRQPFLIPPVSTSQRVNC